MTKLLLAFAVLAVSASSSSAQSLRDAPAILGSPTKPLSGSTSGSTRYDQAGRGSREPASNAVPNRSVLLPPPSVRDSKGRPR